MTPRRIRTKPIDASRNRVVSLLAAPGLTVVRRIAHGSSGVPSAAGYWPCFHLRRAPCGSLFRVPEEPRGQHRFPGLKTSVWVTILCQGRLGQPGRLDDSAHPIPNTVPASWWLIGDRTLCNDDAARPQSMYHPRWCSRIPTCAFA